MTKIKLPARGACHLVRMDPRPDSPVLAHARSTLARASGCVVSVRARLGDVDARQLDAALEALTQRYATLAEANDAQLAAAWSEFFVGYDRLLTLLRAFEAPGADPGEHPARV